jgi:hypothetical protein
MTNNKWNFFRVWEEENKEIQKIDSLPEEIFSLLSLMLSRNPKKRPNASEILHCM